MECGYLLAIYRSSMGIYINDFRNKGNTRVVKSGQVVDISGSGGYWVVEKSGRVVDKSGWVLDKSGRVVDTCLNEVQNMGAS